jgi:hypothetical protein
MRASRRIALAGTSAALFVGGCHLVDPLDDLTSGADAGADVVVDGARDAATCDADLSRDENNCGRCGRSCFGGGCDGGVCGKRSILQKSVGDVAYADGVVYFTNGTGDAGAISTYVLATQQSATIVSGRSGVDTIAVRPPYVYWSENGAIARALIDGGSPAPIVPTGLAGDAVGPFGVNAKDVYYRNESASTLERAPAAGGSPVDVPGIAFTVYGVRASDAVVAYNGPNDLFQLDLTTNGTASVPGSANFLGLIAITSANVYFTEDDTVYQVGIGKAQRTKVGAVPSGAGISALGADETGVYWGAGAGGIYGCDDPRCATGAHFVTATGTNPHSLAVAPDSVFFVEPSAVTLFRAAR